MSILEEKQRLIDSTIALKEADHIPITCLGQCYPVYNAGYTTAEALYDFDKYVESIIKYIKQYEPDAYIPAITTAGQGPLMELFRPKTLAWPGSPNERIDENSIHQFIEFPILQEEDMDLFKADYTGWLLTKGYPAISGLLEPMADWNFSAHKIDIFSIGHLRMLSSPAVKEMMQTIWKMSDMMTALDNKNIEFGGKLAELGIPALVGAKVIIPFDAYSDFHRGTLDTMMDLYEYPDVIKHFTDRHLETLLKYIKKMSKISQGKWVFMPLHKGMDSFLTDQQYKEFYWPHLQKIICHIIDVGMVPYVYTEGPYSSRLKYLSDVPKGKVVYSFEEVDPLQVKKEIGDTACITGIFPIYLLHYGSRQAVIDEVKRLIDILAPGGGYIFSTDAGFDHAKPENVEAMFDTIKTYGKR